MKNSSTKNFENFSQVQSSTLNTTIMFHNGEGQSVKRYLGKYLPSPSTLTAKYKMASTSTVLAVLKYTST